MNKTIIVLCFVLCASFSCISQSLYEFEYRFTHVGDSTIYKAFFIRNEDGSGLLRIRYQQPVSKELVLVELNMQEEIAGAEQGSTVVPKKTYYQPLDTLFLIGDPSLSFTAPVFWYTLNELTGLFEPSAFSRFGEPFTPNEDRFIHSKLLLMHQLEKKTVLQYFTKDEPIYKNLFEPSVRGLSEDEKKTTLYYLGIANTNDPIIGEACGMSMRQMMQMMRELSKQMGIKFVADTIAGKIYHKKEVEKMLERLRPSSNDIVVLYYMGHGFRKTADERPFPFLDLRWDPNRYDYMQQSLNIEDIFNRIRKKKSRFNLVLSDCCNTDPAANNIVAAPVPIQRDSELPWNIENFRKLFLDPARISILATAADVGQKATSNNKFGGFFSYYFKTALRNSLGPAKKYISWDVIMAEAKKQTVYKAEHTYCDKPYIKENICRQYPFYRKIYEQF